MKVHEILKEDEFDDAEAGPGSEHAAGNLDFALSDMAIREFMKIEQDPVQYYKNRDGQGLSPDIAQGIAQTLSAVDDKTLELMGNSNMVQQAVEANYDSESDSSFIPLNVLMDVVGRVQERGAQ